MENVWNYLLAPIFEPPPLTSPPTLVVLIYDLFHLFHSKEEDSPFALAMQNGFAMQNGSKALPNDYDLIPPANWKMATMEEKMISYLMKEYIESNKDKVFRQNSLYTSYEE